MTKMSTLVVGRSAPTAPCAEDGIESNGAAPARRGRPILVTGSHRSGTTWVGRILASSPDPVGYVREPFSLLHRPGVCSAPFPYWFPYVCEENEHLYQDHVAATLRWSYRAGAEIRALRQPRDVARMGRDWLRFHQNHARRAVPLLKDPIAIFSAEWLARRFEARVLVLVRHPAAFAASIKRWHWNHPFGHFLAQPLLMRDVLAPYADEIRWFAQHEQGLVDQAILLWVLIYDAVAQYQERHPDWLVLRNEDLSRQPVATFRRAFHHLGLAYDERVTDQILATTSPGNPVEAARPNSVYRDSARHVFAWKRSLSSGELRRARQRTSQIAARFYSDDDW